MANNKLILRTLNSPWVYPTTDITKNSVLTHSDVDNNFIYLKGEVVYTAQTSGTDLILNKVNNSNIVVDLSSVGAFTHVSAGTITPTNAYGNTNPSNYSSILGGSGNTMNVTGYYGGVMTSMVIGGGKGNTNGSIYSNIGGGSNNTIGVGMNYVYGNYTYIYGNCVIGGGSNNNIDDLAINSVIGGGGNNNISFLGSYSVIGGGINNNITSASSSSSILGGENNNNNHKNSHIIGSDITSVSTDTTHVEKLNIKTLNGTTAVTALGLDVNGMVVDGSTLGGGAAFTHVSSGIITPTNAYGNVNYSDYSSILGGYGNSISGSGNNNGSVISGGFLNTISLFNGTAIIGGGVYNTINSSGSIIAGGQNNEIKTNSSFASNISGGRFNLIYSSGSVIGGGENNVIGTSCSYSTIAGGSNNNITGSNRCVIVGGSNNNTINSLQSFVGGGENNTVSGSSSSIIVGGENNTIEPLSFKSIIGGGELNVITSARKSFIGAGENNSISGAGVDVSHVIVGGYENKILSSSFFSKENNIIGGRLNLIEGVSSSSTIVGGSNNNITGGTSSIIGGGETNIINSSFSTVGGGRDNVIDAYHGFIGGGDDNHIVDGVKSIIGGGERNEIHEPHSFIGGGLYNRIQTSNNGNNNSIVGGTSNIVSGTFSTVGGGKQNNIVTGWYNTIAGGFNNTTNLGGKNIIGGGENNSINNYYYSSILGGENNTINHSSSHIIGSEITSVSANTTHVEKLNIKTLNGTVAIAGLGIDANGMIVSATTSPVINEINDNLILEGTTNATTSQAIYGVNIITTATTLDLATRLPAPTTGRQTVFINNSLLPIKVFPSVVGGEINGVVDGVSSIPNDGRAYTFYCTQNPLPGAWTWSAPAIQQLALQEMEINHTNGVSSAGFNAGQGTANESSVGLGWGGSGVLETGTWNTNNFPAWVEKFKVYTNIKWADIAGGNINAFFTQGYQNAPTGTSTGNKAAAQFTGSQAFPGANIQEVLGGTAGDNVGDIGTLYMELPFTNGYPLSRIIGNQAITNPIPGNTETCYSKGYYTFEMNINSNATTKLYKFQWFIEYS